MIGVDPQSMMIAVRRVQEIEGAPAIDRAKEAGVQYVQRVRRFWIGENMREVLRALTQTAVFIHFDPVLATVI